MIAEYDEPVFAGGVEKTGLGAEFASGFMKAATELVALEARGDGAQIVTVFDASAEQLPDENVVRIDHGGLEIAECADGLNPSFPSLGKVMRLEMR